MRGDRTVCPEGRISSPTRRNKDGRDIVDITTYIPYFLSSVNNALSLGASSEYLKTFGIGIADWRVISMLAIEPRIPAARIVEVISIDKGATSRSLNKLAELGLVDFEAMESDPRRRTWELNAAGYELHDRILAAALEREKKLIEGADPDDLEAFLRVIRLMRKNVDRL
ncbi:MarR family transcriptional regulator [Maritimibacter sp. UBA3975]|uniref:MarR family winged helix-turn-helix transcriptional regulator n=1 Tax=Maritimibacter sp. UBA3975 TaxID=1946833 RepID=UPI000C099DE6|nr:MarR family transcriptional regulator [Maritimibacter sp. UBA3975]MAM60045.1 transcriptional regulator [Maritimibacter sp.]